MKVNSYKEPNGGPEGNNRRDVEVLDSEFRRPDLVVGCWGIDIFPTYSPREPVSSGSTYYRRRIRWSWIIDQLQSCVFFNDYVFGVALGLSLVTNSVEALNTCKQDLLCLLTSPDYPKSFLKLGEGCFHACMDYRFMFFCYDKRNNFVVSR